MNGNLSLPNTKFAKVIFTIEVPTETIT